MTNPNDFHPSAPKTLVNLLRRISRGKDILRRLLTDPRMKRSWALIGPRCPDEQDFERLWSEIVYALVKSRTPERSRAKMRDHFLGIAKDAEKVATSLTNGPLDRLILVFFSDDEAKIAFTVENWSRLEPEERFQVADPKLACWPSMTGLLKELANQARRCANEAITNKRIVDRDTYDRRFNYFVRHLSQYFREHYGGPMEGTLANIASAVFEREIDRKLVRQALRHKKGGA